MIQRFYQYLFLFKEYVILVLLISISLVLLVVNDNAQIRQIRSLTVGTIGVIQQTFSFIPNLSALQRENELLRKVNVNLADEVNQLREARLENIRLRAMIALRETSMVKLISAKVIAKNLNLLRNTITLNVGANDQNGGHPGIFSALQHVIKISGIVPVVNMCVRVNQDRSFPVRHHFPFTSSLRPSITALTSAIMSAAWTDFSYFRYFSK